MEQVLREEEVGDVPETREGQEDGVAADKGHDEGPDTAVVGGVGHEPGLVGQGVAADALGAEGTVEEEVGDGHAAEVDELRGGDEGDEPVEDDGGVVGELEEGQQGDEQDEDDAVDGDTGAGADGEEARGLALEGHAVEGAGGAVDVGVAGGEGGGEDHGVDKVRHDTDAEAVHGNDVGGGGGAGLAVDEGVAQLLVVVGDKDADAEGAEDEKGGEAVEDGVEGTGHDVAGVLSLAGGHGDVVGAGDGEGGLDETLKETEEAAEVAVVVQLGHGAGLVPEAEAEAVALGVAAEHDDEGEDDEGDDEQDLAEGRPELGLAVPLDGEDVEQAVEDDDDGDDGAGGDDVAPVVNDEVACGDLKGDEGGLEDEEVPAGGEAKGLVDVAAGEADEGRGDGQEGDHLGHAQGDGEDDGAPHGEGEEEREGPAVDEAAADLDVESSADGAADADELDVARLELALDVAARGAGIGGGAGRERGLAAQRLLGVAGAGRVVGAVAGDGQGLFLVGRVGGRVCHGCGCFFLLFSPSVYPYSKLKLY